MVIVWVNRNSLKLNDKKIMHCQRGTQLNKRHSKIAALNGFIRKQKENIFDKKQAEEKTIKPNK